MDVHWPLVGRARELELLTDVLVDGERLAVILSGRAGVGKTRLASEWLEVARSRGLATACVTAGAAARRMPFGALAPLLPGATGPTVEPADMLHRARADLVALGGGRPLVLFVDDAHLLDDASATLVHQLVSSRSAFVIATVRTEAPAPDPIVALWKDDLATRIELEPLGSHSVESLLTSVLGGPLRGETLHRFAERSAGNVLYLRELVLAGLESGDLRNQDGMWCLTDSPAVSSRLVELVEARLGAVDDPARKVLECLAFGEPLGVACLKTMAEDQELVSLERQGLIVTAYDGRRVEARLGHPLYGEVIRARISALRQQVVCRNLADGVLAAGARRSEDALRFATWRLDTGGGMAPDLMVAAAVTARNRWDLDLAGRLADAALQAGAGIEAALLRAEVALLQGRTQDAGERLATLLPQASTDAERASVTAARVEYLVSRLGRNEEAAALASEAAAQLSDPEAHDLVVAKQAFALDMGGRLSDALEVLAPVLARAGGPSSAFAWYTAGACLGRTGRFTEALEHNEKGARIDTDCTGSPPLNPFRRQTVLCSALIGSGRLLDAEKVAASAYSAGVASGSLTVQALFGLYLARIDVLTGKVADARRQALEARHLLGDRHWVNMSRTALGLLALAHGMSGSADLARAALAELDGLGLPAEYLNDIELGRARAWAAAAAVDMVSAGEHLRSAAARARHRGAFVAEAETLHDMARLGWPEEAAPRLRELGGVIEGHLITAQADHALALGSDDAEALSRVSRTFGAMGASLVAAEAEAAAAVILVKRGLLRQAAAAELRAAALARACQGAKTPALRAIQTQAILSGREIEVAALAAAGVSNRDIADRLSVSVRTVENHLHRVYEKLGVTGRADLLQALTVVC